MNNLKKMWQKLTKPQATDADDARLEYTTKVLLLLGTAIALVSASLTIILWAIGVFDQVILIGGLLVLLIYGGGFWLANLGYWRAASYIPPTAIFLVGALNGYLDGFGSTAILYYSVALLLTAMLQGIKTVWVMLFLCLGTSLAMAWAFSQGYIPPITISKTQVASWSLDVVISLVGTATLLWFFVGQFQRTLAQSRTYAAELEATKAGLEEQVEDRTAELQESLTEREQLHQQVLDAQQQIIRELSTPIIPIMDRVIVMPLVGSIDTLRARDITRTLLTGISQHQAKIVIVDITGVAVVDTGVVNYLNKTIQTARLKGARTIVTGISDAVAETIVELGIDWSNIETLRDLQTGLGMALKSMGVKLSDVSE